MAHPFIVTGNNANAPFTLKVYRGEGMCLLAMNWRATPRPPDDFVGFAIEIQGAQTATGFFALKEPDSPSPPLGRREPESSSPPLRLSPIQKFRWVHFPRNAELAVEFHLFRATPVFMNDCRRTELRRSAAGRDRAAARDLPGTAQRHVHARIRFVRGVRRPVRSGAGPIFETLFKIEGHRRAGSTSLRRIPRPGKRWHGCASRRGRRSSTCSTRLIADPGGGSSGGRLRPERARARVTPARSWGRASMIIIDDSE